ncbi:hypothetical protein AAFC00_002196 [Neodothiora populina]|uniref:Large ribosomal subunit protein mL44 n=1 Tax=Neodothiora populina TaxID=2781224 RepID=A0ABR3PGL5_9PEZI
MKGARIPRWGGSLLPPRNLRLSLLQHQSTSLPLRTQQPSRSLRTLSHTSTRPLTQSRCFSLSASSRQNATTLASESPADGSVNDLSLDIQAQEHSPSPRAAAQSAKLAALHARLSLPARLPVQTLARCLVDASADPRPEHNNASLATIGQDLLGFYTAEWLICNYPRLPMEIVFAAQAGYVGPKTLDSIRREWGVEAAAAPGPEVDAGLLQVSRVQAGNAMSPEGLTRVKDSQSWGDKQKRASYVPHKRGVSTRIVNDSVFDDAVPFSGLLPTEGAQGDVNAPAQLNAQGGSTLQDASATFVRALFGALYLHAGGAAAKSFHTSHILSRHLPLHSLFAFKHPTRDLSRLCQREGFESPVARLLSETGRHSRSPVFIVGVYSGEEKLGEGEGASLDEARVRAAANAMRSWYLYTPLAEDVVLPSEVEGVNAKRTWKPQTVDIGEIVT